MKKTLKTIRYLTSFVLILSMGLAIGCSIYYYPKVKALYLDANQKVSGIKDDTFKGSQTSLIYDNKNQLISKLKGAKDVYYLDYDKIPDNFKYSFIAIEDKNFLTHKGVDLKANARAVYALVRHRGEITQGASTITQQLSRNVFLTFQKSYERKIEEVFISVLLEKKYDKEQILEFYLNSIYFSNGAYGIESASRKYFGKSSSELNLAEITFISAIPNNPTLYDPIRHFGNTQKRKERILDNMKTEGYISEKECQEAKKYEIKLSQEKIEKHNYVETYVLHSATTALMRMKGFEFKYTLSAGTERENYEKEYESMYSACQKELYTGGYRIYTSIDMTKQKILSEAVDSTLSEFSEVNKDGTYAFQGAATSIDNNTGKVVAIVGGRNQEVNGYTLNRAFQSHRQPGSTFKPLVVYTPAFENGYLPSSLINDQKLSDGPKNSDSSYEGPMPIRTAVAKSKNSVAWQLFQAIGVRKGMSYVEKMEFEKICEQDYNLASSLGGLTYGASTLEMASAYSTIERDGYFYEPTCINKITDASGKVLYNDTREPISVYTSNAARIMTNVLQTVMAEGTGARVRINNMPCAGKTGTTSGSKDGWFAGYTPYYTTVVWCGYDIPKTLNSLYGSSYPGQIWNKYMSAIHDGLPWKEFEAYNGLASEESAVEEKIKAEEQKKVLIDEIESKLNIYLNKEINSLSDVTSLEDVYNQIVSSVNQLQDNITKQQYLDKIKARKTEIDNKKKELADIEKAKTVQAPDNKDDNTIKGATLGIEASDSTEVSTDGETIISPSTQNPDNNTISKQ